MDAERSYADFVAQVWLVWEVKEHSCQSVALKGEMGRAAIAYPREWNLKAKLPE